MNVKRILGNFSVAIIAQGIVLIGSVLTSLLVPKVMGVTQFGYWQLFIFYGNYIGFFHLGLNDGVYLFNGGLSRKKVDKQSLNSQFVVGMLYQLLFSAVIIGAALMADFGQDRMFVLVMTGVYLLVTNGAAYIGYVLQAMDETRRYSAYSAINGTLFLVPLVAMLALRVDSFQYYVIFYTLAHAVAFLVCLWWVRDFIPCGLLPVRQALADTGRSIRAGIKLMIANVASMLILGISRFFVDSLWSIEVFGMVSFALSMVSFFLLFASQASMVLFPALRKADEGETVRFFQASRDALDLFLPVCYLLYFPAVLILGWWLPKYEPSFIYFAYLMPVVVFNGKMNMVGNTYLLVLRREGLLLGINAIAVAVSGIGALVGAFVLHSIEFMIAAAVLALMWRSVHVERMLAREFGIPNSKLFAGSLAVTLAFLASTMLLSLPAAFAVTAVLYAAFLFLARKQASALIASLKAVFS
ncbi:MAG: hypothetical protein MSA55_06780 [Coriobacteriaceae bacterium]|nr:hypothetical protein [Coriobacteriaceae bacterium]MDD6635827.1 hypothetical protein [Coriobacteriaceae bacterium]MDY3798994.1 hypothetical protein [Eggerthellaceae bacterium]MDY4987292.1 hypothetical protein [Eggerthellaceae bacterium]MDY5371202.1 hypothetical protein [Eggerthellaceae bacterium]